MVKKPIVIDKIKPSINVDLKKCIDLNYLNIRTKSNPTLMMEMILLYLEQTPTLISSMKKSLEDNDWHTLQGAAHKIIPSFAIMGMHPDFENMAKKIQEYAITQEQAPSITHLVKKIENVCNQAYKELREELNRLKIKANE